jgi:hypothetical protein
VGVWRDYFVVLTPKTSPSKTGAVIYKSINSGDEP